MLATRCGQWSPSCLLWSTKSFVQHAILGSASEAEVLGNAFNALGTQVLISHLSTYCSQKWFNITSMGA